MEEIMLEAKRMKFLNQYDSFQHELHSNIQASLQKRNNLPNLFISQPVPQPFLASTQPVAQAPVAFQSQMQFPQPSTAIFTSGISSNLHPNNVQQQSFAPLGDPFQQQTSTLLPASFNQPTMTPFGQSFAPAAPPAPFSNNSFSVNSSMPSSGQMNSGHFQSIAFGQPVAAASGQSVMPGPLSGQLPPLTDAHQQAYAASSFVPGNIPDIPPHP